MEPAPSNPSSFRQLLKNSHFVRLWVAQLISQTIQNAANFGSLYLLATQSQSFTAVGGIFVSFSLPIVLLGVPAGVLVDRVNKKFVLWGSNFLRAIVSFAFIVTLINIPKGFAIIYLLTFVVSAISQFFGPAEGAAIPSLVKEEEIVSALSLFNVTFTLAQALGFIMVGPLVIQLAPSFHFNFGFASLQTNSVEFLFLLISIAYLICAALTFTLPGDKLQPSHNPNSSLATKRIISIWRSIIETGVFVWQQQALVITLIELTIGNTLISIIGMIAPNFSAEFMHRPQQVAALFIFLPAGIGLVGGSALMPRVIHRIGFAFAELMGFIVVSVSIFLITASHWGIMHYDPQNWPNSVPYIATIMLLSLLIGVGLTMITLPAQTLMQKKSPNWIRGRIISLQTMVQSAALIPIIPAVGAMADIFGLTIAFNVLAVVIIFTGFLSVYLAERTGGHSRPVLTSSRFIIERALRESEAAKNASSPASGAGPTSHQVSEALLPNNNKKRYEHTNPDDRMRTQ